ncbi:hypothetical protein DITRI_Ditri01bG0050800 [Diplodiscus trichospermus]
MSFLKIYKCVLHGLMKLVGLSPQTVEIELGTVINVWVPTETTKNTSKNGAKPAVVFIHGLGFDGITTWQFQAFALAKDYSVYVPDLVFFGGSTSDKAERDVKFQAECMAMALRKLGVEKCSLVCLSYGGMIGFKMAEMFPDLVDSMVVSCSVMAMTESISNAALKRLGFSNWEDNLLPVSVEGVETYCQVSSYHAPKLPNWIYKDLLEQGMFLDNRKEKSELLKALVIKDEEFTCPCYQQRIHLLWGKNDKIFDLDTAINLKEQIGEKATLEFIDKAGHGVQFERPFQYNCHLKKILASFSN